MRRSERLVTVATVTRERRINGISKRTAAVRLATFHEFAERLCVFAARWFNPIPQGRLFVRW